MKMAQGQLKILLNEGKRNYQNTKKKLKSILTPFNSANLAVQYKFLLQDDVNNFFVFQNLLLILLRYLLIKSNQKIAIQE
jgi:hypothetical protein